MTWFWRVFEKVLLEEKRARRVLRPFLLERAALKNGFAVRFQLTKWV